jgi:hypothetical protein
MRVSRLVNPHALDLEFVSPRQPAAEEVSLERLYGPVGAEFAKRFGRRGVEAFYRKVPLAELEKQIAAEAATVQAVKPAPMADSKPAEQMQSLAPSPAVISQALAKLRPEKSAAQKLTEAVASEFGKPKKPEPADLTGQTPEGKRFANSIKLPASSSSGVGALPAGK